MDPNATLARIRELAKQLDFEFGRYGQFTHNTADEFLTHVVDLDDWLSKGGFLPVAWERQS